jgi:putative Holliday junction resolvase
MSQSKSRLLDSALTQQQLSLPGDGGQMSDQAQTDQRAGALASYQLFMAFDYGTRRIGVAYGTKMLSNAQPLESVRGTASEQWQQIAQRLADFAPQALVVGVPCHPDGAAHDNTHKARRFIRQLQGRFNLPVFEVDERYSTTEVYSNHQHDVRKVDVDSESACIILNQFFRTIPS